KPLLDMLTLTIEPVGAGILCLILLGAVLGAIGALFIALPRHVRRPLSGGVVALGLAGLFQELIRPILANSSFTKPVHDLLYTYTGLRLRGAIIIFAITFVAIIIRDLYRQRIESAFDRLAPTTQRNVR